MDPTSQFTEVLTGYVERSGYSRGQLGQLSGIPKRTIANWIEGRVQQPRGHNDLLKLAAVLHLREPETTRLLQSAGYPSVTQLWSQINSDQQRELLTPWIDAIHQDTEKIPFQAIADLPFFVGREVELQALKQALVNNNDTMIFSIQGMAGCGKTVLAARAAYQLRPYFPDGTLWARLDTSNVMSVLKSFANAYQQDISAYSDIESCSCVVRELLAHKRALIVLDNAQTSDEIRPFLPPTRRCAVIITTRRHDLMALAGMPRCHLQTFSPEKDDALHLFSKILGSKRAIQDKRDLSRIAAILGHLPLALSIAASRLAYEPDWSTAEFLTRLRKAKNRLALLSYDNQSVRRTIDATYDILQPNLQQFFARLTLFGCKAFSAEMVADAHSLALETAQDNLRKLYNLSLIQLSCHGRYQLHPLVADYTREKLSP